MPRRVGHVPVLIHPVARSDSEVAYKPHYTLNRPMFDQDSLMPQDMFGAPWTPGKDQEDDDDLMDEEPELDTHIEADNGGILMLPVQFKEAFMGIQVLDPKSPLAAYDVDLCLVIIKRHYGYTDYQAQEHFKETIGDGLLRVPRAPIFIHRFIADWDVIAREELDAADGS